MTYTIISTKAPQVLCTYEGALESNKLVDSNLELLEMYMTKLAKEKESLLRQRKSLVQQIEQYRMLSSSLGKIPIASIASFLPSRDLCSLSSISQHFREQCRPEGQLVISHLKTPKAALSVSEASALLDTFCLPLIETLSIEAKAQSGKALMKALSTRGACMTSLREIRVSAAAETGDFLESFFSFMTSLHAHQVKSVHFSGFRSLAHIAKAISTQTSSIESFKVDYFVNGHEKDVTAELLLPMPNLRSLVYDVADVVDLPVHVILGVLTAITDKSKVTAIYLPHMAILGESAQVVNLIEEIKQFRNLDQLVVRFRHLPLSVKDIVALRENFEALPAVCISDHFVVMLASWAAWWPDQRSIWDSPDKITGLSVFREQIDFESLGTTANREWLRLTSEQKQLWSRRIAPQVLKLYLGA